MQITFEVDVDYGDDGPDEAAATPTEEDIERYIVEGIRRDGLESPVGVNANRQ
jgi:hypothetical protein